MKTAGKGEARTLTLKEMIRIRITQALINPSWEWNIQPGVMLRARPAITWLKHQKLGLEVANTNCLWPGLVLGAGGSRISSGNWGVCPSGGVDGV